MRPPVPTQLSRALRAALVTATLGVHGAGLAQPERTLPGIVISASSLPLTEAALNQHVHVFTREQIEAHPAASVGDFLLRQAGIPVDRRGRNAGYGSLYLRGADPSHVVVLIDGVRQNDPLSSRGSAVDLNSLSLDDIERIEVIRGNASVAHGEAMAGVVALFTADPGRESRRVRSELGGDGARALSASWTAPSFRLSASHRQDGDEAGGRLRVDSLNLGHRARRGGTSLRLDARLVESLHRGFPDDSGGLRFAVNRELESNRYRTGQLSAGLRRDLGTWGAVDLGLQLFAREGRQDMPAVAPGVRDPFGLPRLRADAEYDRVAGHLQWLTQAGDWNLLVGLQWQREQGVLDSTIFFGGGGVPAFFSSTRRTTSLFAEAHRTVGRLSYHLGLRSESTPGQGTAHHPAVGVQYQWADGRERVGASVSSAAKLPSFFALGHPLVGNPQLTREATRQLEAYYAREGTDRSRFRLTAFRARYLDLVDFDTGPPPRLLNRGTIDATGIEWTWRKAVGHGSAVRAEGTAMALSRPPGADPLRHRPRHQWLVGFDTQPAPGWALAIDLVHVGRRFDSSIPTGGATLEAYDDLRLSLTRRSARWDAYAVVDNVLGSGGDEVIGTPNPGRRLRVGLRYAL